MTKIFSLLIIFLLLSCGGSQNKTQADSGDSENAIESASDPVTLEVEQAALSFYKWYLKAVNSGYNSTSIPFDVDIVESKDGMCRMDFEPYFNELRKLGTISDKFIESERKRNSTCEDYLKTIHYKTYEQADAYTFDDFCPQFSYMYWILSQEPYQDVKAVQTNIDKDGLSAYVDVSFIYTEGTETPIISKIPNARIFLESEQGKWKIIKIALLDEKGQERKYTESLKNNDDTIFGSWSNDMVSIDISEKTITFKYHEQCVYFYPAQVVNKKEVILIWANNMDCKFDNGTNQTFGLERHPKLGEPFARYTLEAEILYTEYFYKEWIGKFRKEVNKETFSDLYFKKTNDSE